MTDPDICALHRLEASLDLTTIYGLGSTDCQDR
jgi:hypothetical protein